MPSADTPPQPTTTAAQPNAEPSPRIGPRCWRRDRRPTRPTATGSSPTTRRSTRRRRSSGWVRWSSSCWRRYATPPSTKRPATTWSTSTDAPSPSFRPRCRPTWPRSLIVWHPISTATRCPPRPRSYRPGPAGRLAGGAVPWDPGHAGRPADGGASTARGRARPAGHPRRAIRGPGRPDGHIGRPTRPVVDRPATCESVPGELRWPSSGSADGRSPPGGADHKRVVSPGRWLIPRSFTSTSTPSSRCSTARPASARSSPPPLPTASRAWASPTTATCTGCSTSTRRRKAQGINPIIGTEAYMAYDSRFERPSRRGRVDDSGGEVDGGRSSTTT
jgi:hypothetical protein